MMPGAYEHTEEQKKRIEEIGAGMRRMSPGTHAAAILTICIFAVLCFVLVNVPDDQALFLGVCAGIACVAAIYFYLASYLRRR